MELDSFLASPRWDILKKIIEKPTSPSDIANELGTTISYISQQLKLLEAAGIVQKKRTGAVEKGKPRTLYSLTKEIAYIIPLTKDVLEKKVIELQEHHKVSLRIWTRTDLKLQPMLERAVWRMYSHFPEIDAIYVDSTKSFPRLLVGLAKNEPSKEMANISKEFKDSLAIEFLPSGKIGDAKQEYTLLHTSEKNSENGQNVKGGLN